MREFWQRDWLRYRVWVYVLAAALFCQLHTYVSAYPHTTMFSIDAVRAMGLVGSWGFAALSVWVFRREWWNKL